MLPLRTTCLSAILAIALTSARADWRLDAETGWLYDSNLSNSDRAADEEHDWSWQSRARAATGFQLAHDLRLTLAGDVVGAIWHQYSGFNQIGGGGSALLRYRFGLGREAPWISLENRIGYDAFEETPRNGWDDTVHLRGGFSFNDRMRVEGGYTYENSCTRAEDFWSWCAQRGDVALIIDVTAQLQVSIGYSYRDGDVFSYAIPPRPDLRAIAKQIDVDNTTFGQPLRNAYKLNGQTHAVSVFANYALTKYLAIQAGYEFRATSHDPLQYENHLVTAKFAFSY